MYQNMLPMTPARAKLTTAQEKEVPDGAARGVHLRPPQGDEQDRRDPSTPHNDRQGKNSRRMLRCSKLVKSR